ncbi:selenocysteine-specific elongation factor [Rubritalea halochordaticola]|uniref:Selenocysteine-specific elongation factor n=1 Tax=Rubritalea halochordaticola TaxID=714537 RepID=A0ABP9V6Z3_9BACT
MHLILGTAGHIDHGKSSLVKVLTGTDPDRLPEEKARGVTIELGFAHLTLGKYEIGLIDVPGHADFVNNMVSGVGALDIALFIVAADDGWMPQSEEHLHILNYLGVKNVIIALTKADLAEDLDFTVELVREELLGTTLEEAPIVPVSSITGMGTDALKEEILKLAVGINHNSSSLIPRLSVDRAFSPTGVGTVVTGTLTGSDFHKGDQLVCLPQGLDCTVRNAQNHNQSLDTVSSGTRTALNLPDLPLSSKGKPGVKRGSVITTPGYLQPTLTLDVQLQRDKRPITGQTATKRVLKNTETVILHHGTSRTRARIVLHSQPSLHPGEACFAQLRLEEPIAACTGDRFVLRDGAQQGTLAGGIILDANAKPRLFRSEDRAAFLTERAEDPTNLRTVILSELRKTPFLSTSKSIPNTPFTTETFSKTCEQVVKQKKATQRGNWLLDSDWWQQVTTQAGQLVTDYHQQNPDAPSIPIEAWRKTLAKSSKAPADLLEQIQKHLLANGYSSKGDGIASQEHSLELPEKLQPIADKMLSTLKGSGLTPPPVVELAPDKDSKQVLTFLIRSGQVIELDPKAVLEASVYEEFKKSILSHIQSTGKATASEIRQATGATRKTLMPTLERLDAEGLTLRDGDYRSLS